MFKGFCSLSIYMFCTFGELWSSFFLSTLLSWHHPRPRGQKSSADFPVQGAWHVTEQLCPETTEPPRQRQGLPRHKGPYWKTAQHGIRIHFLLYKSQGIPTNQIPRTVSWMYLHQFPISTSRPVRSKTKDKKYLWHNLVDINSWRQACQPLLRLIEWGMSSLLFTASPSKNAFVMSNPIPFSQCFATLLFVKNVDLGVPHPRNSLDQSIHMEVHSAPAAHTAR